MSEESFSNKMDKTHIAYIHETWRESFARDFGTVASFLALWSAGHFAESAALEWVGVVLGCLFLFGRGVHILRKTMDRRMTPDQARAWLDKNFPKGGDA